MANIIETEWPDPLSLAKQLLIADGKARFISAEDATAAGYKGFSRLRQELQRVADQLGVGLGTKLGTLDGNDGLFVRSVARKAPRRAASTGRGRARAAEA